MKTIDMRGNPCPIPVITAKKELAQAQEDGVHVWVDNIVAVQNLEKMANGMGYKYSHVQQDESFMVTISKTDGHNPNECAPCEEIPAAAQSTAEGVTVLITSDQMGRGSEELGKILIKGFVFSLTELPVPPKAVIFLNSGVQLVVNGSNTVPDLQTLQDKGTSILACGTCLNYFALTEQLAIGEITDMFGITEHLASATNLITL